MTPQKKMKKHCCAKSRKLVHFRNRDFDHKNKYAFLLLTFSLAIWWSLTAVSVVFHFSIFNPPVGVAPHGNHAALLTIVAAAKPLEVSMNSNMSLRQVSDLLNVRMHRIAYCLSNHLVPEPKLRIASKRVFSPADVRRLAKHFGVTLPAEAAEPEEALAAV